MLILELSVLAAYVIRKLLQRHAQTLQSVVVSGAGLEITAETDLNAALKELYPDPHEMTVQINELEVLVRTYRELEGRGQGVSSQLRSVEQEIFWILGLKIRSLSAEMTAKADKQERIIITDAISAAAAIVTSRRTKTRFVPLFTQSSWIEALCPRETDLGQGKYGRYNAGVVSRN